jgi:polyferredoxin
MTVGVRPRKAANGVFFQRRQPDSTQRLRKLVQWSFLALNIWIGVEFFLFVRFYESWGHSVKAGRPAGVEGWLPIASLMNLKYWVLTRELPSTHAAGMFLLIAFLTISVVFRKAFCGWLCPVGTVSEYLWRVGRAAFGRNFRLPGWLDWLLRGIKYALLGLFLYAVGSMSAPAIRAFLSGPYGVIADVKMLNFFRYLSMTSAVVLAVIAIGSFFIQNFWCRYFCPYGALMGLASLASLTRIRREPRLCIDCAKCAKACPSGLAVDKLVTIRSAECIGCMDCVSTCPAEGALEMVSVRRRAVPGWAVAVGIAAIFFAVYGAARWSGRWDTQIPESVYQRLIPAASEFGHP